MATHILLTGASRGIGAAIAESFKNDAVRLIGQGTRSGIRADFADPAAPRALWNQALDALDGRIDVLINNAGVFESNPLDIEHDD
ncbi:3-oxoacyl-ACP reductase, partial [Salmonella enterica subsp. enterica serovar Heidelberg]|nr:3-oxoacyl-ACP reductase [Salmonella enterica subsp. enterica serovar Heidelberg]